MNQRPQTSLKIASHIRGSQPVDPAQEIRHIWEVLYPIQLESERLLSVIAVDAACYERGAYALHRHAKAEGVSL